MSKYIYLFVKRLQDFIRNSCFSCPSTANDCNTFDSLAYLFPVHAFRIIKLMILLLFLLIFHAFCNVVKVPQDNIILILKIVFYWYVFRIAAKIHALRVITLF